MTDTKNWTPMMRAIAGGRLAYVTLTCAEYDYMFDGETDGVVCAGHTEEPLLPSEVMRVARARAGV